MFYYVKIGELAQLAQGNTPAFPVEKCKIVIDAIAFLFIATVVYIEIDEAVSILGQEDGGKVEYLEGARRAGYIFIALGILFGGIGAMTLWTIKVHFKRMFRKHMCTLAVATFALSVPTIITGILAFLHGSKDGLYEEFAS